MGFNARGIEETKSFLQGTKEEVRRATRNAVRSTASSIRTSLIKQIASQTGLSKKLVSDSIRVQQKKGDETAQVYASTRRIPLNQYNPSIIYRGSRGTVHADVSMTRNNQTITDKVYANPASSRVFKRKGNSAYPIITATGPSVFHQISRVTDLVDRANETLIKLFWDRLQKQIAKRS